MRIIITGASGLLGRATCKAYSETSHQVLGLAKSRVRNDLKQIDLTDKEALESLVQEFKPDVIIHTAAERRPDVVEKNRDAAFELNVNVPAHLAALSKTHNFLLIYISTDYVFDGTKPPYDVNDKPNPLNLYGETKYKGEIAIQNVNPQAIVLRVPILYGEAEYPGESAVNILVESVKNSSKMTEMDNYAIRYPTNVQDVARIIKDITEKHVNQNISISGVLHFSANESFTKYQMCEVFSRIIQLPMDHLKPTDSAPAATTAKRPYDCHLLNEKLASLRIDVNCVGFEDWWRNYSSISLS